MNKPPDTLPQDCLEHVESVRLMRVQPGDTIVANVPDNIRDAEAIKRIRDAIQAKWPDNDVVVCMGVQLAIAPGGHPPVEEHEIAPTPPPFAFPSPGA